MKFLTTIALILLWPSMSFAFFKADVFISFKKGVDQDLLLKSEVQSTRIFEDGSIVEIKMKNGLAIELKGKFSEQIVGVGPGDEVIFQGELMNARGDVLSSFSEDEKVVSLGKTLVWKYQGDESQYVEIKLKPYL